MAVEERGFEHVWPTLSARLSRVLQRRRVPDECVDDVVQETGLRLLKKWSEVDHTTIWSLTLTIAGNIIKDDMRRRMRDERYAEVLKDDSYVDIEERAIARIELSATHRAIEALNAAQRTALLSEVYGFENTMRLSRGAVKMSRMRARRRLRETLGHASGLVALTGHRLRRVLFGEPRIGMAEGASHTVAAALLIAAGLDLVMLGGGVFRSQVPGEIGRVSLGAPFTRNGSVIDVREGYRPGQNAGSYLTPSWTVRGGSTDTREVIEHRESVGPNGANGSFGSSVLGQRASVVVEAERSESSCQGGYGRGDDRRVCVGSVTAGAAAHYNGKTYGVQVSSKGTVTVVRPRGGIGSPTD